MARKILDTTHLMTLPRTGERNPFTSSLEDFADDSCLFAGLDEMVALSFIDQSACEFQDYCNHLYCIDGRCDCPWSWKKSAGLALPASA
ncbi:MAG: hypothetical protein GXX82_03145 [Syntrophorhabdus sp.]|jgi:hypothetical protein|nr:hypothetical protein [Syntrophorhabdus sp.]